MLANKTMSLYWTNCLYFFLFLTTTYLLFKSHTLHTSCHRHPRKLQFCTPFIAVFLTTFRELLVLDLVWYYVSQTTGCKLGFYLS